MFKVTAIDAAGNMTTKDGHLHGQQHGRRQSTPGGTVPATLSLSLRHAAPTFGAFTPGVARDVQREHDRERDLDRGQRALSVADPSSTNTGKLVNGTFTLANALTASATSAGGDRPAAAAVGGSAAPTTLLTYSGPIIERRGDAEVRAEDRRERGAPQGHLQQDADVHAQHDRPVGTTGIPLMRAAPAARILG